MTAMQEMWEKILESNKGMEDRMEMNMAFYRRGVIDTINRMLEIIEQGKRHCQSRFTSRMDAPTLAAVEGLADRFRDEVLALKGGD